MHASHVPQLLLSLLFYYCHSSTVLTLSTGTYGLGLGLLSMRCESSSSLSMHDGVGSSMDILSNAQLP